MKVESKDGHQYLGWCFCGLATTCVSFVRKVRGVPGYLVTIAEGRHAYLRPHGCRWDEVPRLSLVAPTSGTQSGTVPTMDSRIDRPAEVCWKGTQPTVSANRGRRWRVEQGNHNGPLGVGVGPDLVRLLGG